MPMDRLALIAQAVARHQPVRRGCIVECEDCGRDVWRAANRGGVRRLCKTCADGRHDEFMPHHFTCARCILAEFD